MGRILQLVVAMFVAIFLLSACGLTGDKRRVSLSDNRLTVPLAESVSNTRGAQYSLYRIKSPKEDKSQNDTVRVPKSGFFDKSGIVVLVDPSPVTKSREFDGNVTFDLPLDPQIPENCFIVADDDRWVTPLSSAESSDSKYLIGLAPFGVMIDWLAARESLRSTKLRIAEASATLPHSPAFVGSQCIRREARDPPKPADFMTPSKAKQIAKESVFQSMTSKLGCEQAIHLIRRAGFLGLFAGALICGENSPNSETIRKATLVDKLLDGLLFQCAAKRQPLCLLGFAAQLKTHAVHDTETLTQQLSQPYRTWQQKGEELRKAELNEYTSCNEMLEITNSAASTIIAINRSIAVAEQNLERMKARKNPNGTYEFDSNTLTCYRALSNYIRGTWEYEK